MIATQDFQHYDAVVIGAGNGGLTAAVTLAANGLKVILLEQHNLPGGFATSFVRGRFEFEPSLHEIAGVGPEDNKGDLRILFDDTLGLKVNWVRVPESYRLILTHDPDGPLDVIMPFGVPEFIEKLEQYVPGSRGPVTGYFELCREVTEALGYIVKSRGNPDKKVLTKEYGNFLKTAPYTMDDVAKVMKIPEKARKILHAYWCYLGPETKRASFTIFAAMLYKYISLGAYIPKYRSHEMATALETKFRQLGGRIEYNTKVEQILVEKGSIVGVLTSQGDKIRTHHVISNASPHLVYNQLISPAEVPPIAYQHCNFRKLGPSAFVVYLGLNQSPEQLKLNEYSYFIFRDMNTSGLYESTEYIKSPGFQAVVCLNNAIPDCSPPGTTILSLTTLFQGDAWQNIRPAEYVRIKNQLAGELIAGFEEALKIRIKDAIEEIEIATPPTFARYTGSFNGGVYGYEPGPLDSIIPRMLSRMEEKYIKGLDFVGGSAFRCHGYSSSLLSGESIALLTFKEWMEGQKNAQS